MLKTSIESFGYKIIFYEIREDFFGNKYLIVKISNRKIEFIEDRGEFEANYITMFKKKNIKSIFNKELLALVKTDNFENYVLSILKIIYNLSINNLK